MQVQVNTDNHTAGSLELTTYVESMLESGLSQFGERITRVEVHFTDENGRGKSGEHDKRCLLEARLAGLQPLAVSADGSTLEQALSSAVDKLETLLKRTLGRMDDHKGRTSFAG